MNRCTEIRELLSPYLEEELSPENVRSVEGHLADCPACRADLELLRLTVRTLRDLPEVPPPTGLLPAVRRGLAQRPWYRRLLPRFGGGDFVGLPVGAAAALLVALGVVMLYDRLPEIATKPEALIRDERLEERAAEPPPRRKEGVSTGKEAGKIPEESKSEASVDEGAPAPAPTPEPTTAPAPTPALTSKPAPAPAASRPDAPAAMFRDRVRAPADDDAPAPAEESGAIGRTSKGRAAATPAVPKIISPPSMESAVTDSVSSGIKSKAAPFPREAGETAARRKTKRLSRTAAPSPPEEPALQAAGGTTEVLTVVSFGDDEVDLLRQSITDAGGRLVEMKTLDSAASQQVALPYQKAMREAQTITRGWQIRAYIPRARVGAFVEILEQERGLQILERARSPQTWTAGHGAQTFEINLVR